LWAGVHTGNIYKGYNEKPEGIAPQAYIV